ncbi:type II toxin-antitoxin system VapC family toxin [Variovorax sp. J22G73]|uniref:type II toxin-antitoxin system VapC family toxin n=1 Tax=unclassified Variovorax TaxID=663243 RepID=UPI000D5E61FA|nr:MULTISPECIES: type II toxin-antitoxin system VapC family toxin [unclassified Variovorax]MDM0009002.1 type II toxin-antitoxin system VapC family toxin [Variovorax sp. J22R203]MDM0101509.1 type II toxin-antitoxin system VapC family toxin [Variovorax sp. J22G73]
MARTPVKAPVGPLVLDSSCWLEVFGATDRAKLYQAAAADPSLLIVPVVTLYEVYKTLRRIRDTSIASLAAAYMQQGELVELDAALCLAAADNGLPFADSLIYATAQARSATLWTQDAHFDGLVGVKYFSKP